MRTKIGPLLERARGVQREQQDERRAAYRSAPVPFVPKPPPPGWLDLEEDIAAEFAALSLHYDALEDAYERMRSETLAREREAVRLARYVRSTPRVARLRQRRREAMVCRECRDDALPGQTLCAEHAERNRRRSRATRSSMVAVKRCLGCKAPAETNRRRCRECLRDDAARAAKRRPPSARPAGSQGPVSTCVECSRATLPGQRRCAGHAEKARARTRDKKAAAIAAGRCVTCTNSAKPGRRKCRVHLDKDAARARRRFEDANNGGVRDERSPRRRPAPGGSVSVTRSWTRS